MGTMWTRHTAVFGILLPITFGNHDWCGVPHHYQPVYRISMFAGDGPPFISGTCNQLNEGYGLRIIFHCFSQYFADIQNFSIN